MMEKTTKENNGLRNNQEKLAFISDILLYAPFLSAFLIVLMLKVWPEFVKANHWVVYLLVGLMPLSLVMNAVFRHLFYRAEERQDNMTGGPNET